MSLSEKRRQIRRLLDERNPADAQADYYAFYHPNDKTQLFTLPGGGGLAQGYICLSRTGIDLFRPLLTSRLPSTTSGPGIDLELAKSLFQTAVPPGTGVIMSVPEAYYPVIAALFEIQARQALKLMILDQAKYEPIINVLVTQAETYNGLPRFLVRSKAGVGPSEPAEIAASAGLNWRSPQFAEIYVHTKPAYRRRGFGRSVVAAIVQNTLESGRTPLYAVGVENDASIQLAESVGFVDIGAVDLLLEAAFKAQTT